ncbi:MAG: hypothetical protein Q7T50_02995, partial [Candidatus Magasanikbacteria bacterium]|nr:hypothetical protein [Candidatus Magasanikbacteria bacterium]
MRRREMVMPMPTPEDFPEDLDNKIEDQEKENETLEKGQESESWAKEAWSVFKNKLDEYSSGRVGTGIKMYAGDTMDFVKEKLDALSKSDKLEILDGLAVESSFIVGAKNNAMEYLADNFSYNFKNKQLRNIFQNSAEISRLEKEKNYNDIAKLENGEMKDLERLKAVGAGAGTLIKYGKLTAGAMSPVGGILMGTMATGHSSEVLKNTRLKVEEVIEKTRVGKLDEKGEMMNKDDFDRAWDEAYRLYDEAVLRSKDGEVSAKDLDKIYQENLPKDILARIERNENFDGLSYLQKGMISRMGVCAKKVEAEFEANENS